MSLDRFVFLLGSLRLCNIHQGWAMWDEMELFQITKWEKKAWILTVSGWICCNAGTK
jgi:hypothetical protein